MKKIIRVSTLLVFSLLLSGCWESSDVKFHEPGKYFGASDSHKTDTGALQERFAGQMDR